MSELTQKRQNLNKILMLFVGAIVLARIVLYVIVIVKGIGSFGVGDYMATIINFVMYISILKYTYDYFIKGKDVSLSGLIFKFGIARLATLLGLVTDTKMIFNITAILVFLVPYLSSNLKTKKVNVILLVLIFVLCIVLSYLYITNPVNNQIHSLGTVLYNLDSFNPAIQWLLFTILFFVRGLIESNKI